MYIADMDFKMVGGVPIPTVDNLVRCIVAP